MSELSYFPHEDPADQAVLALLWQAESANPTPEELLRAAEEAEKRAEGLFPKSPAVSEALLTHATACRHKLGAIALKPAFHIPAEAA